MDFQKQISQLLEESFFDIQSIERLIYFPNFNIKFINHDLIEKFGSILFKYFNGIYFCVVKKNLRKY